MPPATLLVAVLLAVLAAAGGVAEAAAPGGSGTARTTSSAPATIPTSRHGATSTAGGSGSAPMTSSSYSDEPQQDPVIHSITVAPGRVNQLEIHYDGLTFDKINITDSGHLLLPNATCDGEALRKVKEEQEFRIADYALAVFGLVSASLNAWFISRRAAPKQAPQQDQDPQQDPPPQQQPQVNIANTMSIVVNR